MKTSYHPIHTLAFWRAFGIHMRPYLLFVSGSAGLSGMAIAENFHFGRFSAVLLFLVFFLAYGFGQALTDSFQVDTDRLSAPYRPLSQGIVRAQDIRRVATIGLLVLGALLIGANPWNLLLAGLSIIGLATYTYFKRNYWWAGPFYNAWIVALLPIMGYLSIADTILPATLWRVAGISFWSYALFVLMGYLKDITADRETGYQTFPVCFGWKASVWVGDVFVLLTVLLLIPLVRESRLALIIALAATLCVIAGQLYAHLVHEKVEEKAQFPIVMTVRAFVGWQLAILLCFHPGLWAFALVFYLLFEWILYRRPSQSQI